MHGPRTWVPVTAVSTAAAAAMAIALLAGGGVAPSLAQAALEKAARASAKAPSTALVPGKDWYVRVVSTNTPPLLLLANGTGSAVTPSDTFPVIAHSVEETWMTRDGASHLRARISFAFAHPGAAPRRREELPRPQTEIIGSPPNARLSSPLGQQRLISYRQLRALPANVPALRRVIDQIQRRLRVGPRPVPAQTPTRPRAAAGRRTSAAVGAFGELRVISWLLAMPVSAPVRAALYRTAASLKAVHYDGSTKDPLRRTGVEISVEAAGTRLRMIFDPTTGRLLSTSTSFGPGADGRAVRPLVETIVTAKIVPDASRPGSIRAKRPGER